MSRHWKQLLDPGVFLSPGDFATEREVTISRVVKEKMKTRDGEEEKTGAMMYILQKDGAEYPRPYKVCKSVLFGLSLHLGTDPDAWVGKKVTLFACYCMSFGEKEETIRVRFPGHIDVAIRKMLKKHKASPSCYMIDEARQ